MFSLEKAVLLGYLIAVFQNVKGLRRKAEKERLLLWPFKLKEGRFRLGW